VQGPSCSRTCGEPQQFGLVAPQLQVQCSHGGGGALPADVTANLQAKHQGTGR
jgi:hypothetical protein